MLTVAEIEAAIDALAKPEQEQVYSHLTAKFAPESTHAEVDAYNDPVIALIERLERETPAGELTDVAINHKEHLYGYGSDE